MGMREPKPCRDPLCDCRGLAAAGTRRATGDKMPRFRKKPIVIDAFLWNPLQRPSSKAWRDLDAWLVSLGYQTLDEADGSDDGPALWVNGDESITIPTLEGDMRCDIGDWIIRGVLGEFYPIKAQIFAQTYEPVDDA